MRAGHLELLDTERRLVAPIPAAALSQVALPGKGELDLQFLDDDGTAGEREDEVLVEMRLFVPAGHSLPGVDMASEGARAKARAKARRGGSAAAAEGGDEDGERGEGEVDKTPAPPPPPILPSSDADAEAGAGAGAEHFGGASAVLHGLLTDVAKGAAAGGGGGEAVAELPESVGQLVVPRGRYAIELYASFMRLVGRTYEFKVAYRSVARMFFLEKPYAVGDAPSRYSFVIGLTDPVRQGNQRHPYLVLSLDALPGDGEFTVPLRLSAEDVAEGRFGGLGAGGRTSLTGELPKTVAMLFKHVTGKPVYKAGAFRSAAGQKCVRCAVKSNDGLLYVLDKSLLFLHKPTTWVPYADVEWAEMKRGGDGGGVAAGRTFDLVLHVRASAGEPSRELTFQSIDAAERSGLRLWLGGEGRGVRVTEQEVRSAAAIARGERGGMEGGREGGGCFNPALPRVLVSPPACLLASPRRGGRRR